MTRFSLSPASSTTLKIVVRCKMQNKTKSQINIHIMMKVCQPVFLLQMMIKVELQRLQLLKAGTETLNLRPVLPSGCKRLTHGGCVHARGGFK